MKKWFVEVVKDTNGRYHANMMINGKVVEGLARDIDYKTLREDIKNKTGIKILKHDDMLWVCFEGKDYAYIDNTQPRLDCRIYINEIRGTLHSHLGWRPAFDADPERINKQVVLGPYTQVDDVKDIYVVIGTIVDHKPGNIGELCEWAGNDIVHLTEKLYLDGRKEALDKTQEYYEQERLYDSNAYEIAVAELDTISSIVDELKLLPRKNEPKGMSFYDFLDGMDLEACTDAQLIFAKNIAKEFIGPQSFAVSCIDKEIISRFEKAATVESIISNATQRSNEQKDVGQSLESDYVK